jgi:transposase
MKPYLRITLNEAELSVIEQSYIKGIKHHIRQKSQAVLLSHNGMVVPEIAVFFQKKEETVRRWLWGWKNHGLAGFDIKKGRGKSSKLQALDACVVEVVKKK